MNDMPYQRPATPMERLLTRSPFSIVTMVARITGAVREEELSAAVDQVRLRHPNLRVRLVDDEHHRPWLTAEGAAPIPIEVIPRRHPDQWITVAQAAGRVPFSFDDRPPIRFILLQSPEVSDLVIMCHHIICDGMSLAYLARDLIAHLGDPTREVAPLPDPNPITLDSMPGDVSLSWLVRSLIGRINRKWQADPVYFNQQDYETLSAAYWDVYDHRMRSIEMSKAATEELVARCRREGVTVNTALAAAFAGAQAVTLGTRHHADIAVGVDLRGRLRQPEGETMGFYAGAITEPHRHDANVGFWANARRLHPKLQAGYTSTALFKEPLTWNHVDPSILEAVNFKKLGGLVPSTAPGAEKLRHFSARNDVVLGILKRDKMESLDRVFMGTAITNLTRLDFPTSYGPLQLERLIMKPGGAFPLVNVNLVVGAATAAGRLSLVLEYVADNIDEDTIKVVEQHALEFLAIDKEVATHG